MAVPHRRAILKGGLAAAALLGIARVAWAAVRGTVVGVVNAATSKKPEGAPAPLTPGVVVEDGSTIEAGKDSAIEIALAEGGSFFIGARSSAAFEEAAALLMEKGKFRYKAAASESFDLQTPTLRITQQAAEFVVEVRGNGDTLCGVLKGKIVCTSKRNGKAAEVGAGQSVVWAGGSFGNGVTEGVYRTGDLAVDESMDAARAKHTPPPPEPVPPPAPVPPQ
jgi:ferric-dicitrate binding protein FerR (iron transport regulator)